MLCALTGTSSPLVVAQACCAVLPDSSRKLGVGSTYCHLTVEALGKTGTNNSLHHHAETCALCARAGRREWPAFRDWFADSLTPALNAWMGSVEVVYEGKQRLDPERRYVFGYAPHGLFPIGARNPLVRPRRGAPAPPDPLCGSAALLQSRNHPFC